MKRVTIGDLMAATGTGKRTTMRLVREGKLPGFVDGSEYICSPGEFQKWLDGEWKYTGVRSSEPHSKKREPVGIRRINGEAA